MKLGIFDSGLGGLLIAKAIHTHMPDLDTVYFGDTLHLPYGSRSDAVIYDYSVRAVEFLFEQGCQLIVVACNTVSATALRPLQQKYLPASPYADRRILGVVVPTLESALDSGATRLGVIATAHTVQSDIYSAELKKIKPGVHIAQQSAPLLVPLIENEGQPWMLSVLEHYMRPLLDEDIECLILGCTHYSFLKDKARHIAGDNIQILSQDEIIPLKLEDYLRRHPEISNKISRKGERLFYVSDITPSYQSAAQQIYGEEIIIEKRIIA